MPIRDSARSQQVHWLWRLACLYSGVAFAIGTQDYLLALRMDHWHPWSTYVASRWTQWIVWTGWTPLVVWLGGRFRLDHAPRVRHGAIHAIALLVATPLIFVSDVLLLEILTLPGSSRSLADKLQENFRVPAPVLVGWLLMAALTWLIVLAVSYAWRFRQESQVRHLEASQLQTELVRSQLQALKNQVHPHFLFNALNAISTLIATDPPLARRVVLLLAGLLRRALSEAETQQVPLVQEIEFARSYLEIEQVRFSNRLTVSTSIEPGVGGALVPHLILQPLVENAVRHGIAPKAEPGTIRLEATSVGHMLRLSVIDDGVGTGPGRAPRGNGDGVGVGLANVKARLALLYGAAAHLDTGDRPDGGFSAVVVLPLRRAEQGAADVADVADVPGAAGVAGVPR